MNKLKKIISIVTISTFLFTLSAGTVGALTAEELQVQITALMAQLATLQTELAVLQGGTGTTVTGCTITSFDRALKVGMTGDDVKCLQIVLNSDSATIVASSGVGSSGNETSYFGPLTKTAAIKFQEKYASEILASWGLTAGTGYIGSTTRAKLNTILSSGTVVTPDVPVVTAAGLTVALSALTPATGVIITSGDASPYIGQALVPFTTVNFSAGSEGSVTVTTLKFRRIGISADANFDNVYLYEGDAKLLEGGTISSTYITFNDATGIFTVPAGQTKSITLKANLNYDVSAGKTMSFDLVAAADITSDASAVNGTFPISGKVMSVANATDLGYVGLVAGNTPGSLDVSVNPQTDYEVWRVVVTANSQDLEIERIVFTEVGSIQSNDLQNFKLYYGGTLLGTAEMDSNYQVAFDLSASPFSITKGTSKILKLYADIVKGSTRTFKFTIQYPTDFIAKDANYGVYVPAYVSGTWAIIQPGTAGVGNYKIAAGSMSVTKATDSPTSNVAVDGTNVSLAKYNFKAVGEDIKISTLLVSAATSIKNGGLDNGKIYLDGAQVGSTKDLTENGATPTSFTFGSSFIVPAGTTSVVEIKADIKTATSTSLVAAETITIYIEDGSSNAQGQSSLTVLPIPATDKTGNTLTVQGGSLTFTKVSGYGAQTTVAPATEFKIGSFSMLAGSTEGIDVDSITVAFSDSGHLKIESLLLKIGADQIGSLKVTPSDSNLFSINVSLAASESKVVDVYADILSTATTSIDATGITVDGTGTTVNTSLAANVGDAVALQIISIGSGKLTVDIASDNPDDALVVGETQDVVMAKYKFSSTYEAFTATEIKLYASSKIDRTAPRTDKSNLPDFLNVWLSYKDIDNVTQTTTKRATFVNGMIHFTGLSLYVPANGSADLTVYADLNGVAAAGSARTGDRPQISLAYYKANSGSMSVFERRTGLLHYGPGTSGTTVMTWVDDNAAADETDDTGTKALRFKVAGGGSDGAEIDIPLRDLDLNVMDIDTITFYASSTVANTVPMLTLFVDCDLDGTHDGEILYQPGLGTIAADTWTLMTVASTTAKILLSWGGSCSGADLTSGEALSDYNDADAKLTGISFSIWTGSNAIGTYDVDNLVIIVNDTTYNTNGLEDDMGDLGTNYVLNKTKPTVTRIGAAAGDLANGVNVLYKFNVAADAAGDVGLKVIAFEITGDADLNLDTLSLWKGTDCGTDWTTKVTIGDSIGNADLEGTNDDIADGAATSTYVAFTAEEIITAGDNQTYCLNGLVSGVLATSSIQTYMDIDSKPYDDGDANGVGLGVAYASVIVENNTTAHFIWSDRSYGSAHSLTSLDWINGFLVKTLGTGLVHTISP